MRSRTVRVGVLGDFQDSLNADRPSQRVGVEVEVIEVVGRVGESMVREGRGSKDIVNEVEDYLGY